MFTAVHVAANDGYAVSNDANDGYANGNTISSSSTDGSKERTITFRTRKDMYEPRARQLLSAEEQAEEEAYLASTEVPTVAMASESLESTTHRRHRAIEECLCICLHLFLFVFLLFIEV